MKRKNYIVALLAGLVLFACKDPHEGEVYIMPEDLPASNYMRETQFIDTDTKLNLWADVLERAGLYTQLNLDRVYTCFAPTNEAVINFLQLNGYASVSDLSVEKAYELASYHIIPASRNKLSFVEGVFSDTTASGDKLNVSFEGGGATMKINNESRITRFDITVTNGFIHALDKVLTPITATVWDNVNQNRYGIFRQALTETGIADTLKLISRIEYDEYLFPITIKYYYTLFAVPDEVYSADDIASFDALVAKLGAGSDYTSPNNELNKYVRYHMLDGVQSYADLTNFGVNEVGQPVTSKNVASYYNQGIISFSSYESDLYINRNDTPVGDGIKNPGFNLIEGAININCKNGMMHEVDNWMPITEPKIAAYKHDFANYGEVGQLVTNWHNLTARGNTNVSSAACYSWVSNNASPLYYYNDASGASNNVPVVWQNALFQDLLDVQLGKNGYLDMEIPALVAGKYEISVSYVSPRANKTSGIVTFFIDGLNIGRVSTIGASTSADSYKKEAVLRAEHTFNTTSSHKLRILAGDGDRSRLDYLLFKPIIE